jgi:transposase-like protein
MNTIFKRGYLGTLPTDIAIELQKYLKTRKPCVKCRQFPKIPELLPFYCEHCEQQKYLCRTCYSTWVDFATRESRIHIMKDSRNVHMIQFWGRDQASVELCKHFHLYHQAPDRGILKMAKK